MVDLSLKSNLQEVLDRIAESAASVGKSPDDIDLVAISKTQSSETIKDLYDLGVKNFGENKAQELAEKQAQLDCDISWHFVGKIQSNKLKKVAQCVDLIQSVDSTKQIDILSSLDGSPDILIQLSADGDPARGGVLTENFGQLYEYALKSSINVKGIMHVPPLEMDPQKCFDLAKSVAEQWNLETISMGMTGDYELAIRHGATMIRLGNAIFGTRVYK